MMTMLEECTNKEQNSVVHFLCAKDIHKEMFPVYCGKCLSNKVVHNWVADVPLMTKMLKRRFRSGCGNSQKISMLQVSTHWQSNEMCINVGGGYVEE
jgi:hypothetical protein